MKFECLTCREFIDADFDEMEDVEEKFAFERLHQNKTCFLVWNIPAGNKHVSGVLKTGDGVLDASVIE